MCLSRMSRLGKTLPQLQVICCCPASILPLEVPPSSLGTAVGVATMEVGCCCVVTTGTSGGEATDSGGGNGSLREDEAAGVVGGGSG